jgi:hypothetical protein
MFSMMRPVLPDPTFEVGGEIWTTVLTLLKDESRKDAEPMFLAAAP